MTSASSVQCQTALGWGVALDGTQGVEDLVQLGALPARGVDPGVGGAAVVAVLRPRAGVAIDLPKAADPDGGVDPDQVLAVGAGEALGDQLGAHLAEAVVAEGGQGHPGPRPAGSRDQW